jgi:hypothetical protein
MTSVSAWPSPQVSKKIAEEGTGAGETKRTGVKRSGNAWERRPAGPKAGMRAFRASAHFQF